VRFLEVCVDLFHAYKTIRHRGWSGELCGYDRLCAQRTEPHREAGRDNRGEARRVPGRFPSGFPGRLTRRSIAAIGRMTGPPVCPGGPWRVYRSATATSDKPIGIVIDPATNRSRPSNPASALFIGPGGRHRSGTPS
jgi:hypothetical protein